jgi:peptide/nickel transport system substrate-binding protein
VNPRAAKAKGRARSRVRRVVAATAAIVATLAQPGAVASAPEARDGGIFRVGFARLDYVDPAHAYSIEARALLDTTCARLMSYPDKPPPAGLRLVPEVAAAYPRASRDRKTWTFTLRKGFRFNNGAPVRADAFASAINRTLAPGITSPALQYTQSIVGADDVRSGRAKAARGVVARGRTLDVRFTRPVPDFPAWTTMSFFCAVPPGLHTDPEGVDVIPSAGPYYIADYRPEDRVVIRRNRFYGGRRPHHVDGFEVDLRPRQPGELLDRVERGEADWAYVTAPIYLDPSRRLIAKYGLNKSQFFIRPGFTLRVLVLNSSRPLFKNNPRLRRAVNLALDRRALSRATAGAQGSGTLTDQHLPPLVPGFRNARINPLTNSAVRQANSFARGHRRDGKAIFYVPNFPPPLALAQLAKRQLAEIGLDVTLRPIPYHVTHAAYLGPLGAPGEPWDIALVLWTPDYIDPYAYVNRLLDARFIGGTNLGRFSSPKYNRLMRLAASLQGVARYRRYGDLDVDLARKASPLVPIEVFDEPTLVSKRVDRGCIVLRPALDLTSVCLKP